MKNIKAKEALEHKGIKEKASVFLHELCASVVKNNGKKLKNDLSQKIFKGKIVDRKCM